MNLSESYFPSPFLLDGDSIFSIDKHKMFTFFKRKPRDESAIIIKDSLKEKIVARLNGESNKINYQFKYLHNYIWVKKDLCWYKMMFFSDWEYLIKAGVNSINIMKINGELGLWVAKKLNE